MLWDIIRDFIVQNITGGTTSIGINYGGTIGHINTYQDGSFDDSFIAGVSDVHFQICNENGVVSYLDMGDWLATTLTIISMCLIVAFAIWLVRWVFKSVTSAFLLRR